MAIYTFDPSAGDFDGNAQIQLSAVSGGQLAYLVNRDAVSITTGGGVIANGAWRQEISGGDELRLDFTSSSIETVDIEFKRLGSGETVTAEVRGIGGALLGNVTIPGQGTGSTSVFTATIDQADLDTSGSIASIELSRGGGGSAFVVGVISATEGAGGTGPSDIQVSSSEFDENAAFSATLTATDPDTAPGAIAYALTNDPIGVFQIVGDQLSLTAPLDFEALPLGFTAGAPGTATVDLEISADDGENSPYLETITFTASDINDNAPSAVQTGSASFDENAAFGTTLTATDADGGAANVFTYSLTDDPSGEFQVVGDQLSLKAPVDFENLPLGFTSGAPGTATVDIEVTVNDGANAPFAETITMTVNDVEPEGGGSVFIFDPSASDFDGNAQILLSATGGQLAYLGNRDAIGITTSGGVIPSGTWRDEISEGDVLQIDFASASIETVDIELKRLGSGETVTATVRDSGGGLLGVVAIPGQGTGATSVFTATIEQGDLDTPGSIASIELSSSGNGTNYLVGMISASESGGGGDTDPPPAPVVTGVIGDTGTAGDGVTSDIRLLITGTAEANATVEVFLDSVSLGTTTANGSGAWSFDHSDTALADGIYEVTAQATDAANNTSPLSTIFDLTVDTVAPAAPVMTGIVQDTDTPGDGVTSDKTLAFNGTAEASATVEVFLDGGSLGTTTANSAGAWSFDHSGTALADGSYEITAKATDLAGNTSPTSAVFDLTVDTEGPGGGNVFTFDPSASDFDGDGQIQLSATGGQLAYLSNRDAVGITASGGVIPSGTWRDEISESDVFRMDLTSGSIDAVDIEFKRLGSGETVTAAVRDSGGGLLGTVAIPGQGTGATSVFTTTIDQGDLDTPGAIASVELSSNGSGTNYLVGVVSASESGGGGDTDPPPAPVITGVIGDTGTPGDGVTGDTSLVITGTAEANTTVEVLLDSLSLGTAAADGSGDWSFDHSGTALTDGAFEITAQATDAANNTGPLSAIFDLIVDTAAPAAPVVIGIVDDTDTPGDGVTSDNTLAFNGTAEANATVEVFLGGASLGTTTANGAGAWSFDHSGTVLADGSYAVTAEVTDLAGNSSPTSAVFDLTVDTSGPTAPVVTGIDDDTGTPGDGITSDNTFVINGTADPNITVEVFVNGASVGTTISGASGDWSYDNSGQPAVFLSNSGGGIFSRANIVGDIETPQLDTSAGTIAALSFPGPPNADQPGAKLNLENSGRFSTNIVLKDGSLWGVHAVGNSGRSALRWFEIDEATNDLLQQGVIANPNRDFFYGSIAVNRFGDVVIGFNRSGENQFVSSYAALGTTVNGVTSFSDPQLLKQGVSDYEVTFDTGRNRWGDYSATVVDPEDPLTFWTFQEFVSATDVWSTQISQLTVTASAAPSQLLVAAEPLESEYDVFANESGLDGNALLIGGHGEDQLLAASSSAHSFTLDVGLNFTGSTFGADSGFIPPDTMGAVGPDHIVELINGRYSAYDKSTGATVETSSLRQFFLNAGIVQGARGDPRVLYDPSTERWYATALDQARTDNHFLLIASESSDPTGSWYGIAVDSDTSDQRWQDFPMLGYDADGVYISANMFPIAGRGATSVTNTILSIPKDKLLDSTSLTPADATLFENNSGFSSLQPIVDLDGEGTLLADGSYEITARATNGSPGPVSAVFDLTVDTVAAVPLVTGIIEDTETPGDGVTRDNTLLFIGTAEASSTVEVFLNGVSLGTTQANGAGDWTFDQRGMALADGSYEITVKATDLAGNISPTSPVFDLLVDAVGPGGGNVFTFDPSASDFDGDGQIQLSATGGQLAYLSNRDAVGITASGGVIPSGTWRDEISESDVFRMDLTSGSIDAVDIEFKRLGSGETVTAAVRDSGGGLLGTVAIPGQGTGATSVFTTTIDQGDLDTPGAIASVELSSNGSGTRYLVGVVSALESAFGEQSPNDIDVSATDFDENQNFAATLSATDPDTLPGGLSFGLVNDPSEAFQVIGDQLSLINPLDFEILPSGFVDQGNGTATVDLGLSADDGDNPIYTETISFTLNNVDESPYSDVQTFTFDPSVADFDGDAQIQLSAAGGQLAYLVNRDAVGITDAGGVIASGTWREEISEGQVLRMDFSSTDIDMVDIQLKRLGSGEIVTATVRDSGGGLLGTVAIPGQGSGATSVFTATLRQGDLDLAGSIASVELSSSGIDTNYLVGIVSAIERSSTVFDLVDLNSSNGFQLDGIDPGDRSGGSVASAGDVNGDGFQDILIGASSADPGGDESAGESYVVFGKADGFADPFDLSSLDGGNGFRLEGIDSGDGSGASAASAGDVNGDGFDDLIIGASGADPSGNPDAGESYVVFGKAAGYTDVVDLSSLDGSNGFRVEGIDSGDSSGGSVASAGDVNGDGLDDLIIGAPSADPGGDSAAGETYIVFGRTGGFGAAIDLSILDGSNGFRLEGVEASDFSGASVSSAGDVNGDGFDDVIIGASSVDHVSGYYHYGASYVVFGKAEGFSATIDLSTLDGGSGFRLDGYVGSGDFVASVGDINGDGFHDVAVTANGRYGGYSHVVFGKAGGFSAEIDLRSLDGNDGFYLGLGSRYSTSTTSAGDVNGDGFGDILVGNGYSYSAGETYVVFGKAGGFDARVGHLYIDGSRGFRLDGIDDYDQSGSSVASAGDVNGDGFDDFVIGAPGGDPGGDSYAGESYVVFGRDFRDEVDLLGGDIDNTLTGTAAAEILVGGLGNDTLLGNGGSDSLQGGFGSDILGIGDDSFQKADGGGDDGTGFGDILRLLDDGMDLDLTAIANNRIADVETIDMDGAGANIVTLSIGDVFDSSTSTNTLTLLGDTSDAVVANFSGLGGTSNSVGGFTTYAIGAAEFVVDDEIDQTQIIL